MTVRKLAPRDATYRDLITTMKRDNFSTPKAWIITDGYTVTVCEQKSGEAPTQKIALPRRTFNALINWYTREQESPK